MDKSQEKINENRIFNLQWAGASDYDFENFIIGENIDGNPDFYLNLIIGLAVKYLGDEPIRNLFDSWAYNIKRDKYDLAFLYILEEFAYKKEVKNRPVLKDLRKAYADKFLDDKYDLQRRNLALRQNQIYRLELIRMREILGQNQGKLSSTDINLYNKLWLADDTNQSNLEERVIKLFKTHLSYKENNFLNKIPSLNFSIFESAGVISLERSNMPANFAGKSQKAYGLTAYILDFKTKKRRESFSYIEKTFSSLTS